MKLTPTTIRLRAEVPDPEKRRFIFAFKEDPKDVKETHKDFGLHLPVSSNATEEVADAGGE